MCRKKAFISLVSVFQHRLQPPWVPKAEVYTQSTFLFREKPFKHLDYLYTSAVNEADHPQKTNFKRLEN